VESATQDQAFKTLSHEEHKGRIVIIARRDSLTSALCPSYLGVFLDWRAYRKRRLRDRNILAEPYG